MALRKKWGFLLIFLVAVFILTACGGSTEGKILGIWKAVADGETGQYIEISEERLINRSESITAEYILTETQSDTFMIEIINPEDGVPIPFFEGYFENKDTIKLVQMMGEPIENAKFIRIDNIEEDKAREEAEEEKRAAKEAERDKEQEEQKKQEGVVKADEKTKEISDAELENFNTESDYIMELVEEGKLGEAKERLNLLAAPIKSREYSSSIRAMDDMIEKAKYEREQERKSPSYSNLKDKYAHKARIIDENIEQKHKGDVPVGAYGDYFDAWDGLLNEVWGVLSETMDKDNFELLKQKQIKWVQEKDAHHEKIRDQFDAKDVLTNTTRERTYFLIENFL
ncbi:lysozyme inhibitor LprI family protein [Paraliobacillus salinarum]|uniref:lysozyme inhibitor LprI family protein n=1 Tax=Paraliobacillus salinarum TaxID=1158996 RepID=UPI0015F3B623|nr:lysozyme inhibitor LprI family protein [Paraliobacillus salinarum]